MIKEDEWGNIELPGLKDEELFKTNWNRKKSKHMREICKKNSRDYYDLGTYILRSPGNDLLEFYDSMMLELDPTSKAWSYIPPSIVFDIRYKHQYPNYVFDSSKNFGVLSYLKELLKNYYDTDDHTYWGQIYNKRYEWLIDAPSKSYEFNTKKDLRDFFKKTFNQVGGGDLNISALITQPDSESIKLHDMYWRGKLAGWSIEFKPNDKFYSLIKEQKKQIYNLQKYKHKKLVNIPEEFYRYKQEKILHTDKGIMFLSTAHKFYNVSYHVLRKWVKTKKEFYVLTFEEYITYCKQNKILPYNLH